MPKSLDYQDGLILECRVLRLFFARGIFAERSLLPVIGDDYEKQATDVDVLAVEYGTGFHATRVNVECKSGKQVSKLDRICWLAGVQTLIKADVSHMFVQDVEHDVSRFAKELNILTFSEMQLKSWENSLSLNDVVWFGRSNFHLYEALQLDWTEAARTAKGADKDLLLLKDVQRFLKADSWLRFSYSNLNRLFRLVQSIALLTKKFDSQDPKKLFTRYCLAALLVRFCQFLVDVCEDVLTVPNTRLEEYLEQRLMFGDTEFKNSGLLVQQTLTLVQAVLDSKDIPMPNELNVEKFTSPPPYSSQFVSLVKLCLSSVSETCNLPVAAEMMLFSDSDRGLPSALSDALRSSRSLVLLVKGFFLRLGSCNSEILEGIPAEVATKYGVVTQVPDSPQITATVSIDVPSEPALGREPNQIIKVNSKDQLQVDPSANNIVGDRDDDQIYLYVAKLDTDSCYAAVEKPTKGTIAEAVLTTDKLFQLIPRFKYTVEHDKFEWGSFEISDEDIELLMQNGFSRKLLSAYERERVGLKWIKNTLRTFSLQHGFKLGDLSFRKGDAHYEFVAHVGKTRKFFEISNNTVQEVVVHRTARDKFLQRLNDEFVAGSSTKSK